MRAIKNIVVHCTAGSQKQTLKSLIAGFRALGWKNNGYHIVVDGEGNRHDITPLEKVANGVAGHNANAIHVSYMGGVENVNGKMKAVDNRTESQKEQLLDILIELKTKFPSAKISGHRDFSPDKNKNGIVEKNEWIKMCPCFDAREEYKHL
jgi:N-acetylmuramoyl-L-alanine amidase